DDRAALALDARGNVVVLVAILVLVLVGAVLAVAVLWLALLAQITQQSRGRLGMFLVGIDVQRHERATQTTQDIRVPLGVDDDRNLVRCERRAEERGVCRVRS